MISLKQSHNLKVPGYVILSLSLSFSLNLTCERVTFVKKKKKNLSQSDQLGVYS